MPPTLPPLRFATLVLTTLVLGCGKGGSDSGDALNESGISSEDLAMAESLWTEISGYTSWGQVAPWEGIVASTDVHGSYVQIWANDIAEATLAAGAGGDMPDGAITVKDGYDTEDGASGATAITVMKKVAGYDPDHGDWFFARYDSDGTVSLAGASAVGACADCHSSGQDFVRAWTW